MACQGCGSKWVTQRGKDCTSCPYCCKLSRCKERKHGRWNEAKGQPFLPSVFKKERKRAKRTSDQCGYCLGRLKSGQPKYCSRKCFNDARKSGVQSWDRTSQLEGCYHRGGRWNNAPSKAYVISVGKLDAWLAKASGLCRKMLKIHESQALCEVCGIACKDGASRFCSFTCNKAWRGDRQCRCGITVCNATAFGPAPLCEECGRQSRRVQKRMYGCYRRRCRTYGGHYNPTVKPSEVFERDGWRCHVCRRRTHKVFSVHDPRSATIDHHPIPLSKGGDHDWHNVRCCCFECNSLKGAKWDGQRRLRIKS